MAFYQKIQYCIVPVPSFLGDKICQNFGKYNTAGCGFDGGDCIDFNNNFSSKCNASLPHLLGDGKCHGREYNNLECKSDGGDCLDFNEMYPNCTVEYPFRINNGICDGGDYDTLECGFDGSDCIDFWGKNPDCVVEAKELIGNGVCNGETNYNNANCSYDGGDCDDFNAKYPRGCLVKDVSKVGDGTCDGVPYNTEYCGFDGGDCDDFNTNYPGCLVTNPQKIGNGICDSGEEYNSAKCLFDGGDCDDFNSQYPGCNVTYPDFVGNGVCNGGDYNNEQCHDDGGDCDEFNVKYPNCKAEDPYKINDGVCDGKKHNSAACEYDGGDCLLYNNKYPDCEVDDPWKIGNGICDGNGNGNGDGDGDRYNSEACGWDGSDCLDYNELSSKYPDCEAEHLWMMGDGICGLYNTAECGYEDGDCIPFNEKYPNCAVDKPWRIGDGYCFGGPYNTLDCGYEGGDCQPFYTRYPHCDVDYPSRIGDGNCDGGNYNSAECYFDNNDCVIFNMEYPGCSVDNPSWIGDGHCDGGEYNTEACRFDKDDCTAFNEIYLDCYGVKIKELGDGICQHNREGCNFDDGDCVLFNNMYPKCTVDEPFLVGNGECNEQYNTEDCKHDGGDCTDDEAVLYINGESVSIEDYQKDTKTFAIIQTVSSTISLVASIGIIWIIKRSLKQLSVPYHRLMLGLCVSDICSSLAQMFSTLPAPDTYDVIWNANGTKQSCQTQGFFIFLGSIAGPLYNCSLCFYYLLVVTYKKKNADKYIEGKIEFFLHFVPIALSLIGAATILYMDAFNPNMTYCFIGGDPTCDNLNCDKSNGHVKTLFIIFSAGPYFGLPCIIFFTMLLMHREVAAQEAKLKRFGRAHIVRQQHDNIGSETQRGFWALLSKLRAKFKPSNKSKNPGQRGRTAVMNRALSYSMAFFLTYIFPSIINFRTLKGLQSGSQLSILARLFFPLQGLFNFIVFIYPKVIHTKKSSRDDISWFGAIKKAVLARGLPTNTYTNYVKAKKPTISTRRIKLSNLTSPSNEKSQALQNHGVTSSIYASNANASIKSLAGRNHENHPCDVENVLHPKEETPQGAGNSDELLSAKGVEDEE